MSEILSQKEVEALLNQPTMREASYSEIWDEAFDERELHWRKRTYKEHFIFNIKWGFFTILDGLNIWVHAILPFIQLKDYTLRFLANSDNMVL